MTTRPRSFLAAVACLLSLVVGCGQSPPAGPRPGPGSPAVSSAPGRAPSLLPPATSTPSATPPPATAAAAPGPNCAKVKCVALTFDDGPGPLTGRLLDTLVRAHVPATFFLVGSMVRQHPDVARRIAGTPGMTVANHTMTHPMLTRIPASRASREITENTRLIEKVTGVKPTYFRPPYGLHNRSIDTVARRLGQAVVVWSAGALDWQYDKPGTIVDVTLPQIVPGAIVLAHDIHPWTVKAVPTLIARLRAKGFVLAGLGDILGPTRAGTTYARGRH